MDTISQLNKIKYGVKLGDIKSGAWTTCLCLCQGPWFFETVDGFSETFTTYDINTAFRHRDSCHNRFPTGDYRVVERA